MTRLSTGFVIVGAYAKKLRKTLFAQLKDKIKDKEIANKLAYSSAQLNKLLFEVIVNKLKLEKGDLVKIVIEYEFDENKKEVEWKYDTLKIISYKKVPQEEIEKHLEETLKELKGEPIFTIEKIGESADGDLIFSVLSNNKDVGIMVITPLDEKSYLLKKAVVVDKEAFEIEKVKLEEVESLFETLTNIVNFETSLRKTINKEEGLNLINMIKKKLS
ncbi:MAG: DUF2258 domain-containing protein [Candidatus Aenigmatarchaeota archaeon]